MSGAKGEPGVLRGGAPAGHDNGARGRGAGLRFGEQSQGSVQACHFEGNEGAGLVVSGEVRFTVEASELTANGMGIALAQPTLEGNTCEGNKEDGILYQGSGTSIVKANICQGNERHGISVGGQAEPTLEGNSCRQNKSGAGIRYEGQAAGTAQGNRCSDNDYGFYVSSQAEPLLERNDCEENQSDGIRYEGRAAGTAKANSCNDNQKAGIYVGGQAQPTLEANICQQNRWDGIRYLGSATGSAKGNICRTNHDNGIEVNGQALPMLGMISFFRDDAFAIRTAGEWLAVAVSEGSRRQSRYGSSFAVEALCEHLLRGAINNTNSRPLAPSPSRPLALGRRLIEQNISCPLHQSL